MPGQQYVRVCWCLIAIMSIAGSFILAHSYVSRLPREIVVEVVIREPAVKPIPKKPKPKGIVVKTVDADDHEYYYNTTVDILARTIWGEARNDGIEGMKAVANVILNRAKHAEAQGAFWWGNNIIQICQKPYQFSTWNRSDPNFKKVQAVGKEDKHFREALIIAQMAVKGHLHDNTGGAYYFHVFGKDVYWSRGYRPVSVIGSHEFYRLDV